MPRPSLTLVATLVFNRKSARAKRFADPAAAAEAEKKKARMERFKAAAPAAVSAEEAERRQKRADRFGKS